MAQADIQGFDFDEEMRRLAGGNTGVTGGLDLGQVAPAGEWWQNAGRESHHYHTIPEAYKNIPGFLDLVNNPSADPNQHAQNFLSSERAKGRTDESDAAALTGAGYLGGRAPGGGAPSSSPSIPFVSAQFDDPYTKQLETIASKQMGEVRNNPGLNQLVSTAQNQMQEIRSNPALNQLQDTAQNQMQEIRSNPALEQLKSFLNTQFKSLSETPGFSPEELSVLHTQGLEPIEDLRNASKKRAEERVSARGMLPSSGLHELDMRDIDMQADRARTVAGRDLAINAIDRRDRDLGLASQIATQLGMTIPQTQRSEEMALANLLGLQIPQGQRSEEMALANLLGMQIPQSQRSEELALSSLLYDLPRKALQDALAVTQGSPTANDMFAQATRLAQQNQQNYENNYAMTQNRWAQIAQLLNSMNF